MKSMFWILFGLVGSALMPTLARAQGGCNCASPVSATYFCIDAYCYNRKAVVKCSGIYYDSCVACYDAAIEVPCCPYDPAYTAIYGGSCQIITAKVHGPSGLYARGFAHACDGSLVRTVMGLPEPLVDRRRSK